MSSMKSEIRKTLIQKLNDALITEVPELTRREIRLPAVPGKAIAVIGMRRSGKTCFLSQCMADLLAEGTPRDSLLLMNFEDDRLAGMDATDLSFLLECYYQRHPELRDKARVSLFLDEIGFHAEPGGAYQHAGAIHGGGGVSVQFPRGIGAPRSSPRQTVAVLAESPTLDA